MTEARVSTGMLYIDGKWQPAASGRTEPVHEKATGAVIGEYAVADVADVDRAVGTAVAAQRDWAAALPDERSAVLRKAGDLLLERADEFTDVIMRETGSVRGKAAGEVAVAHRRFHDAAGLAARSYGDVLTPFKPGKMGILERIPLGVVAAIIPWNVPLILALRPVGPALALGNAVVLKPAELTPIAGGQLLTEVLADAGIPPGVFNLLTGPGEPTGQALAEHPDIDLIHFTGSNEVGLLMAQIAARGLKRTSLELGGDNALVVLDDADVGQAAACGAWAAFDFQGQTCITAGRHIVHRDVVDAYTDDVVTRARMIRVGDPVRDDVDLGPIISEVQRDRVHRIVTESVEMGARVLEGGTYDGLFYRPTVLADVTPDMPAFTEEIFGPVLPITVADSEEHALALTNSAQSLVSAVHTRDLARGLRFAQQVNCGLVHVNDAMGRPTGENDVDHFTKRRFVGLQQGPLTYPY